MDGSEDVQRSTAQVLAFLNWCPVALHLPMPVGACSNRQPSKKGTAFCGKDNAACEPL